MLESTLPLDVRRPLAASTRRVPPAHEAARHRAAARHRGAADDSSPSRDARRSGSSPRSSSAARWRPAARTRSTAGSSATATSSCGARSPGRSRRARSSRHARSRSASCSNVLAFVLLATPSNLLAAALTLSATLFYVFVYTLWLKPRTVQNIVIGGAAGAVPGARRLGRGAATAWLRPHGCSSPSCSSGRPRTSGRSR